MHQDQHALPVTVVPVGLPQSIEGVPHVDNISIEHVDDSALHAAAAAAAAASASVPVQPTRVRKLGRPPGWRKDNPVPYAQLWALHEQAQAQAQGAAGSVAVLQAQPVALSTPVPLRRSRRTRKVVHGAVHGAEDDDEQEEHGEVHEPEQLPVEYHHVGHHHHHHHHPHHLNAHNLHELTMVHDAHDAVVPISEAGDGIFHQTIQHMHHVHGHDEDGHDDADIVSASSLPATAGGGHVHTLAAAAVAAAAAAHNVSNSSSNSGGVLRISSVHPATKLTLSGFHPEISAEDTMHRKRSRQVKEVNGSVSYPQTLEDAAADAAAALTRSAPAKRRRSDMEGDASSSSAMAVSAHGTPGPAIRKLGRPPGWRKDNPVPYAQLWAAYSKEGQVPAKAAPSPPSIVSVSPESVNAATPAAPVPVVLNTSSLSTPGGRVRKLGRPPGWRKDNPVPYAQLWAAHEASVRAAQMEQHHHHHHTLDHSHDHHHHPHQHSHEDVPVQMQVDKNVEALRLYVDSSAEEGDDAERAARKEEMKNEGQEYPYTWVGEPVSRSRGRVFYQAVVLQKYGIEVRQGDCVFLRPTPPDRFMYVGRVNHLYHIDHQPTAAAAPAHSHNAISSSSHSQPQRMNAGSSSQPPRRPRGRPPKDKNRRVDSVSHAATNARSANDSSASVSQQQEQASSGPRRRKRRMLPDPAPIVEGKRRRKLNPLFFPTEVSEDSSSSEDSSTVERDEIGLPIQDSSDNDGSSDSGSGSEEEDPLRPRPRMAVQWYAGIEDAWLDGKRASLKMHPMELLETDHVDENFVETIVGKCKIFTTDAPAGVIDWTAMAAMKPHAASGLKQFFVYRKLSPHQGRIWVAYPLPPAHLLQKRGPGRPVGWRKHKDGVGKLKEPSTPQPSVKPDNKNDGSKSAPPAVRSSRRSTRTQQEDSSSLDSSSDSEGKSDADDFRLMPPPADSFVFDYFRTHNLNARFGTSDHTLANMRVPNAFARRRLLGRIRGTSSNASASEQKFVQPVLSLLQKEAFDSWKHSLEISRCNLLLEGLGSKRAVLKSFVQQCCSDDYVLELDGPALTAATFEEGLQHLHNCIKNHMPRNLETLYDDGNDAVDIVNATSRTVLVDTIGRSLGNGGVVYVVVHDIDHDNCVEDPEFLQLLTHAASKPFIRIVASIARANGAIIFDAHHSARLRWMHVNADTFAAVEYDTGFAYAGGRERTRTTTQTLDLVDRGVRFILASFTPSQKAILKLMIETQVEQRAGKGLTFHDLLVACRERFLVSSESVLKSQLGEFRDHQLVTSKRMPDGAELLVINLSSDVMTELLASWPE